MAEATDNQKDDIPEISFQPVHSPAKVEAEVLEQVSLEQLATWKESGDYTQLEKHIRSGALEMLPKEVLYQLVLMQNEHTVLINTVRQVLNSVLPIIEKKEEISKYIDPNSKLKINIGKIMEEVITAQALNPFSRGEPKPLPFIALFQDNIDLEKFHAIDVEKLEIILRNNQIDFRPTIELFTQLGLLENPKP